MRGLPNEMRIYITHCSAKKDNSLKNSGVKVTPDKLYTATPIQRFMTRCKEKNVNLGYFFRFIRRLVSQDKTRVV